MAAVGGSEGPGSDGWLAGMVGAAVVEVRVVG